MTYRKSNERDEKGIIRDNWNVGKGKEVRTKAYLYTDGCTVGCALKRCLFWVVEACTAWVSCGLTIKTCGCWIGRLALDLTMLTTPR